MMRHSHAIHGHQTTRCVGDSRRIARRFAPRGASPRSPVMRSSYLGFLAAIILSAGDLRAGELIEVELVRDGKRQYLSRETQPQIVDGLAKVFGTCSLNSRDHPQIFASWDLATVWDETQAKDHLTVRFSKPVELRAGDSAIITVQQFLLGLDDPRFPGPELTRHGQSVLAYVKCSGYDEIRFVCASDIKHVMPNSYRGLCRYAAEPGRGATQPGGPERNAPEKTEEVTRGER